MSESFAWRYNTPTSKLWLEQVDDEYRLTGEFQGKAQELGAGADLKGLVMSLATSLDTSDPFMRGIETLQMQGEAHGWDLQRMISEM